MSFLHLTWELGPIGWSPFLLSWLTAPLQGVSFPSHESSEVVSLGKTHKHFHSFLKALGTKAVSRTLNGDSEEPTLRERWINTDFSLAEVSRYSLLIPAITSLGSFPQPKFLTIHVNYCLVSAWFDFIRGCLMLRLSLLCLSYCFPEQSSASSAPGCCFFSWSPWPAET